MNQASEPNSIKKDDIFIICNGERYYLVRSSSVHDNLGDHIDRMRRDYQFTAGPSNAIDVIASHFEHQNKKPQFPRLKGKASVRQWLSPLLLMQDFGGILFSAEGAFFAQGWPVKREKGCFVIEITQLTNSYLHIKETVMDRFGGVFIDDSNPKDIHEEYSIDRETDYLFMTDENYDEMINYLKELVGKMNEYYVSVGSQQIQWVD
jgi:hypothetical protein